MPLHAAMQQAMQQHTTISIEPVQKSHCEMQAGQPADIAPIVSANTSSDNGCCCPPALCDAVEAQQYKLFQQPLPCSCLPH